MPLERQPPNGDSMPVAVEVLTDEQSFAAIAEEWAELLQRSPDANVFLSHEWLHSWWVSYRPAAELRLILVRVGGVLVGIAPMMVGVERSFGLRARVLRFVGDGTAETDHITFVIDAGTYDQVAAELLAAIDRLDWDVTYFNHVPEESDSARLIREFSKAAGWTCNEDLIGCPVCLLPASFDELLTGMAPRFRTSLRSSRRRVATSYRVEFGEVERKTDVQDALAALFANHASRWNAKGSEGVFADERKRAFYRCLTPRLLERGWLRFFWLQLDGKSVAQQYCFQYGDTVMLLQEGFDFNFAKSNVGNLLRSRVFERLIEQRVKAYDFLAGESRHKSNWSNVTRHDLRIECARRTFNAFVFARVPRYIAAAKGSIRAAFARKAGAGRPAGDN